MKKISIFLLAFILPLFICQITYAKNTKNLNDQFQLAVDSFIKINNIPSATLTISYPNEVSPSFFASGYVKTGSPHPVNIGNLFRIGSVTKSFVATIILKMQEQHLLSIDDRLSIYLPEYPQWGNITIRQLLNHTSGIFDFSDTKGFDAYVLAHPHLYQSPDQLLQLALHEPPYFEPGKGWHYTNTGYVLLGKVIEKISGKSINDAMNQYIFHQPTILLSNTFYVAHLDPRSIKNRMMHGYCKLLTGENRDVTHISVSWANTAGSMLSNGYDLVQWIRNLFTGKILNDTSFKQFTSLVSTKDGKEIAFTDDNNPEAYGLAIFSSKTPFHEIGNIWWHSGGVYGYKTLLMWLPKQKIAIAMSYTQTKELAEGEEYVPFSPDSAFAQEILKLIAKGSNLDT